MDVEMCTAFVVVLVVVIIMVYDEVIGIQIKKK